MSKMSNLFIQLEEAIEAGAMSFAEIATFYEVPQSWVAEVAKQLQERYAAEDYDNITEAEEWHSYDADC
jgi:predicted XRE-type DNA-binding protein